MATTDAGQAFERLYRFPPFPPVPQGVTIIPFKDFQEYGARVVGEDGIERDGRGIPTIPLPRSHKKQLLAAATNGPSVRMDWWLEWEATGEHQVVRSNACDRATTRDHRFRRAVGHFSKHHKINPPKGPKHLQELWDTFRSFVGVTVAGGPPNELADELSDDDDLDGGIPSFTLTDTNASPDLNPSSDVNENLVAFLDAPARSIEIFLSSHMRSRGQMWAARKLVSAPHLLRFFLNYLLRNQVLPECADGLREALNTVDRAAAELPLVPQISNALPDAFSSACQRWWRRKAEGYVAKDLEAGEEADEPKAKRAKHGHQRDEAIEEISTDSAAAVTNDGIATEDTVMGRAATASGGWGAVGGWGVQDVKMTTNDADPSNIQVVPATAGGWGGGGWGAADANTNTSDQDADMPAAAEGGWSASTGATGWDSGTGWGPTNTVNIAQAKPQPEFIPTTLLTLLGPTALPVTHAPGIVEQSPRRVKTITPPAPSTEAQNAPSDKDMGGAAYAVERVLEERMYRVALAPWLDSNATADPPRILATSRGALAPAVAASSAHPKPHDLSTGEIVVLMEPEAAKLLCKGMGLVATWVQLARVQDDEDANDDAKVKDVEAPQTNLTKKQKARRGLRYWYIDEIMMVLPSYWKV
ncbi:hypothetical protein C8F04DRAFT_101809 [Mycena alexandri]|uniref:Uncharacterized protein n=1 Tax=Mycena alexandri TaxID=1745969 RepID=A0AAD6SH80_9AGAR|nr:hypothetical protein C8F04DRAFT_101809 [Mycena alexandri]